MNGKLMNLYSIREDRRFAPQDVVIGETKRYRSPPKLCRADRPIGQYRRIVGNLVPTRRWHLEVRTATAIRRTS